MNKWLLTNEEMEEISGIFRYDKSSFKAIAKAQRRKLVEWLEEEIVIWDGKTASVYGSAASAKWQALREEIGLEVKDGTTK